MAAGHVFFLSNLKSLHHIDKLQLLFLFIILYNIISVLPYQLTLGHQYAATSLFGYCIENQFQLKDEPLKKQIDCDLDYSTNQDHDEFKDLFDCVSNILFSSAHYPLYSLDTFGSSQLQTHTSIEPNPPVPTKIFAYLYISHNTFGPSQTQTQIYIEPDPPPPIQTLIHSQISHNTFGPSQTQTHTYIVSGSTQTHTFSHILHNTLGTIKIEIHTYLVSDLRFSFIIFGSSQYLILFSFIWCVHYNKKKTKGTNPRTGIN